MYHPPAVLLVSGTVLTNKYAEGYPDRRYYNGCENIDKSENLAIERFKQLFNCNHQPDQCKKVIFMPISNLILVVRLMLKHMLRY